MGPSPLSSICFVAHPLPGFTASRRVSWLAGLCAGPATSGRQAGAAHEHRLQSRACRPPVWWRQTLGDVRALQPLQSCLCAAAARSYTAQAVPLVMDAPWTIHLWKLPFWCAPCCMI